MTGVYISMNRMVLDGEIVQGKCWSYQQTQNFTLPATAWLAKFYCTLSTYIV